MRADRIDLVRHSLQNPASWSGSISQVKSQSSLMQMAGETASGRTASASCSILFVATSGKDTGIVGYNVQAAVDTKNHLIVAHEVTNVGTDRHQLSNIAEQARTEMGVETLDAVADRGYYASERFAPARRQGSPSRCQSR